jgi:CopG family transcriptional regulator, nickel-responsive regulator
MSEIVRFSVSLESDLLERFDRFCAEGQFATRSEAIRQLLREKLTTAAVAADAADVAASLTLVYDHHRSHLTDKMIDIQHAHGELVVSSMHVHLTHDLCMELIALRGSAAAIQTLAAELSGLKGIHQAQVVVARAVAGTDPTSQAYSHPHEHPHSHS